MKDSFKILLAWGSYIKYVIFKKTFFVLYEIKKELFINYTKLRAWFNDFIFFNILHIFCRTETIFYLITDE